MHRVALGSPAAVYWSTRMQPMLGKKFDAVEAETIAICAGQPDSVFVTQDVVAAFVALSELGPGRVALPFDLWRWLLDEGLIDRDQFDALCRKTHDNLKQRLPAVPQRLTGTP